MLVMGTKAETLRQLHSRLSVAQILPQISFTVKEWRTQKEAFWEQIVTALGNVALIVRSSAKNEDTKEASQAGKYESMENVKGKQQFIHAVECVIASFNKDGEDDENQVLVQPMLTDVKLCGVAFTLDPNCLGNYYVINYDETGSTSAVTSGTGNHNKLLYIFKQSVVEFSEPFLNKLIPTLHELEVLYGKANLDVEFAVTKEDELYIFQVRTLCVQRVIGDATVQKAELHRIEKKIKRDQSSKPFLCGKKTIYGVMPDWNPAEMIGIRPKPLAMSLYQEMITDSVWAYQRDNYGYRNLRSFPLMVDFCGLPYIDVRVSFNSFVPAQLDEEISEKLVNYYIARLEAEPTKHDKVEFDIVFSCYTLDLPSRLRMLLAYGFTEREVELIENSLRDVTNKIINHQTGLWRKDYGKVAILDKRYHEILNSDMEDIEKVYWLLEDCKRYGTLPFAGLARAAFIAVQILQSLVTNEILSQEDYQNFMSDVNTVSSNMNFDFTTLLTEDFLKKYGHLRPGTYDITSKRYDEDPTLYFDFNHKTDKKNEEKKGKFRLSLEQMHQLTDMLKRNGLHENILELMDFIKSVIEGREYGKFIFTKNLSKAIQMIGDIGEKYGLSKEECSYINIQTIRGLYASTRDIETNLRQAVKSGKNSYEITKSITLPSLIVKPDDVWQFFYPDAEPNFITLECVQGEVQPLEEGTELTALENQILLIPSADPGYDWIFSRGIKGFITKYGGANSHMAIRAGELCIPAVIGVGEKMYNRYKTATVIEIDTLAKMVRVLK